MQRELMLSPRRDIQAALSVPIDCRVVNHLAAALFAAEAGAAAAEAAQAFNDVDDEEDDSDDDE